MRYLSTLLLTTTFLTATTTYGSTIAATDDSISHSATVSAMSFSAETQAKIDAFETLVTSAANFNISDAAEMLFSPELFPLLSWRSSEKNEEVVEKLRALLADLFSRTTEIGSNGLLMSYVFLGITSSNVLEDLIHETIYSSAGATKTTKLNDLIDGTTLCGGYSNVSSRFHLTFNPVLRLKIYLELLQQTNITPHSLGQILTTTTKLTQMFMSETQEALDKTAEDSKRFLKKEFDQWYDWYFPQRPLKDLPQDLLTYHFNELQKDFKRLDESIDATLAKSTQQTELILQSFGSNALALFQEIFERISKHPLTTIKNKQEATTLLAQTGASRDVLAPAYTQLATDSKINIAERITYLMKLVEINAMSQVIDTATSIANDSTIDIRDRLKAAKILVETGMAKNAAINTYTDLIDAIKNSASIKDDNKFDYLVDVGIGLHKAGATELALNILSNQFNWLIGCLKTNKNLFVNTQNIITMTEILFIAGKLNRVDALSKIDWAVHDRMTGAFFHEAMINGAEIAERMGDPASSRKFLNRLNQFEATDKFKDRVEALEAKLSTATAS